jgi:hypothetical protein
MIVNQQNFLKVRFLCMTCALLDLGIQLEFSLLNGVLVWFTIVLNAWHTIGRNQHFFVLLFLDRSCHRKSTPRGDLKGFYVCLFHTLSHFATYFEIQTMF